MAAWLGGDPTKGLVFTGIMAAYALVLLVGRRRETVRILRTDTDEREELIGLKATSYAFFAVLLFASVWMLIDIAGGRQSVMSLVLAIGGLSYLVSLLVTLRTSQSDWQERQCPA